MSILPTHVFWPDVQPVTLVSSSHIFCPPSYSITVLYQIWNIHECKNAFHWCFRNLTTDYEKRTTTTKLYAHYKNKWCQPSLQYTIHCAIVMRNRHTLISNNWGVVMSHACPAGHRIVQNIYFQRQDLLLVQNLSCKEHCPCARSIYIEMIFNPAAIITIFVSK